MNPSGRWLPLALAFVALVGCDKIKLPDAVEKAVDKSVETVKQTAKDSVESVKSHANRLASSGSIELVLDEPIKTGCYARFVPLSAGRRNVVMLASSNSPSLESFPSVFLHAEVSQTALHELAGQSVEAQMYVQPSDGGPVWRTLPGERVEIQFTSLEGGAFTARIVAGKLVSTDGERSRDVEGTLSGTFAVEEPLP